MLYLAELHRGNEKAASMGGYVDRVLQPALIQMGLRRSDRMRTTVGQ
jgi:hypothetical protein